MIFHKLLRVGTETYRSPGANLIFIEIWGCDSGIVVAAAEHLLAICTHSSSTHKGSPAVSCSAVLCSSLGLAQPKMYVRPQLEASVCGADPM